MPNKYRFMCPNEKRAALNRKMVRMNQNAQAYLTDEQLKRLGVPIVPEELRNTIPDSGEVAER